MAKKKIPAAHKSTVARPHEVDNSPAVDAWLAALEHPQKPLLSEMRAAIVGATVDITEGIKWNSASFYCRGWFATINTRAKSGVQIVLHHGAKVRDERTTSVVIEDPVGLLVWLAPDRAVVNFEDEGDWRKKKSAFIDLIKQWAAHGM